MEESEPLEVLVPVCLNRIVAKEDIYAGRGRTKYENAGGNCHECVRDLKNLTCYKYTPVLDSSNPHVKNFNGNGKKVLIM